MDALKLIAQDSIKQDAPQFEVGDTVRVHVRITEGNKTRIQVYEGTVIAKKHGGTSEPFPPRWWKSFPSPRSFSREGRGSKNEQGSQSEALLSA